jgi:ABC-2 type transport system permease protein
MIGLILKDLLNLKRQARILTLLIGVFFVTSVVNKSGESLGSVVSILAATLPITALAYDERSGWDKYALTMPLSRRDLVTSKYLLGILLSFIGFAINTTMQLVLMPTGFWEGIQFAFGLLGVSLLFLALLLPVTFKLGVEKSRVIMMVMLGFPAILITLLPQMDVSLPSQSILNSAFTILPIVALAAFALSLWVSLKIYQRREF